MSQPTQLEVPAGGALCRVAVDKPQAAVRFLQERGGGVMDLIAHFWERLAQTPPLQRQDLHLVVVSKNGQENNKSSVDLSIQLAAPADLSGAMLYVPKAHRADVLALDERAVGLFVRYIHTVGGIGDSGQRGGDDGAPGAERVAESRGGTEGRRTNLNEGDLEGVAGATSAGGKATGATGATAANDATGVDGVGGASNTSASQQRVAIDFLTGGAEGVQAMVGQLLPLVHRKAPAKQLVNMVMRLPEKANVRLDPGVRLARDGDLPALQRWRKLYKEERGILFDADMDAWVDSERVFVCEQEGQVVAAAKFDLELNQLVEIGGVFTFPEFRRHGFGARIVADLAARIRGLGKTPMLQVDEANPGALALYKKQGWEARGPLARVWLTG